MQRVICNMPDELMPVYRYHLAKINKRTGEYLLKLIVDDLNKHQPEMMAKIKNTRNSVER